MRFPYTMFTLQTSFTPLLRGGGGSKNPLVEVTVNSKAENSYDFCPNYVQEFGLSMELLNKLIGGEGLFKPFPKTAKNSWLSVLFIVPSVLDSSRKLLSPKSKINFFNFKIHFS